MSGEINQHERGLAPVKKKPSTSGYGMFEVVGNYLVEWFAKQQGVEKKDVINALTKQQQDYALQKKKEQQARELQRRIINETKGKIDGIAARQRLDEIQMEAYRRKYEEERERATYRSSDYNHSSNKLPGADVYRIPMGQMQESAETGNIKLFKDIVEDTVTNIATDGVLKGVAPVLGGVAKSLKKEFELARKAFNKIRGSYAARLGLKTGEQVHHAIELQALKRYPGVFSPNELNDFKNMRGIPNELANQKQLHNSKIRDEWDRFYKDLDRNIAEKGLTPGTPTYNNYVRNYLEEARNNIDYIVGQFFTEYRKKIGLR